MIHMHVHNTHFHNNNIIKGRKVLYYQGIKNHDVFTGLSRDQGQILGVQELWSQMAYVCSIWRRIRELAMPTFTMFEV